MSDTHAERTARDTQLDASHVSPWTTREKIVRALWMLVGSPLARLLPGVPLRLMVLSLFGARVGARVRLERGVRIEIPWNITLDEGCRVERGAILYSLGPIAIGPRAVVGELAHLCAGTHDYRHASMPLLRLPIEIGAEACIDAGAFVGPGVRVGPRAILTARSCAFKDLAPDGVYTGNPARSCVPTEFGPAPGGSA